MKKSKVKNENKKNNKKLLLIVLVIMAVALIGVTYAWLSFTVSGTKANIIKAGTLSLDFQEGENKIFIQNAYPLTDAEGEETTVYEFTVTNDGNISSDYEILLKDLTIDEGKTRMDSEYVKYKLEKTGTKTETVTQLMSVPEEITDNSDNSIKYKKLDDGTLEPNESNTYKLQVWMDYDAPNKAQGTVFKAKVVVNGVQHDK